MSQKCSASASPPRPPPPPRSNGPADQGSGVTENSSHTGSGNPKSETRNPTQIRIPNGPMRRSRGWTVAYVILNPARSEVPFPLTAPYPPHILTVTSPLPRRHLPVAPLIGNQRFYGEVTARLRRDSREAPARLWAQERQWVARRAKAGERSGTSECASRSHAGRCCGDPATLARVSA